MLSMLDAEFACVFVPAQSEDRELDVLRLGLRIENLGSELPRRLAAESRNMLQSGNAAIRHRLDVGILRIISAPVELEHIAALVTGRAVPSPFSMTGS